MQPNENATMDQRTQELLLCIQQADTMANTIENLHSWFFYYTCGLSTMPPEPAEHDAICNLYFCFRNLLQHLQTLEE